MNKQKRANDEGSSKGPPAKVRTTSDLVNKIRERVDIVTGIKTPNDQANTTARNTNSNTKITQRFNQPSTSTTATVQPFNQPLNHSDTQSLNRSNSTPNNAITKPSVSTARTATINTNRDPITPSPNSFAALTSPTFPVNNLLPGKDNNATPNPIPGTTKHEPDTTNIQATTNIQPTDNYDRTERNKQLKLKGRIEISLHGTSVYTKDELMCILNTLRAKKAQLIGPNLVRAQVLTGTYTHASQIGYQTNLAPNQVEEELGSLIDQATQANGNQIDNEIYAQQINTWQPLVTIPDLVENKEILPSTIKPAEINFNQRAFINYTKYAIPEDVAVILSMGPKFAVPVYNSEDDFDTLRGTAYTLNEIYGHPEGKAEVRANIEKHIKEYRQNQREYRTQQQDYFQNAIKTTKRFIKEHPDIIAAQSDKARACILLDKSVYTNKVENLLRDATTYQPLQTTSTRAYLKMNEALLKRMLKLKIINEKEMSHAIAHENRPANLYGLLKNHKMGTPVRPIVNTRNSMGFLAATKVTEILTTARDMGLRYNVLNSRMACERIRETNILPDEIIVSLDIVSMFTNITVERAIAAVRKRQQQLRMNDEQMQLIIDIIRFVCIKSTEVMFNDRIYKQIKGLRMGSSLSPILADFVVEDMLDTAFLTIERPKLLIKYVDDILCVLEKSEAKNIQQALNNCDPHIKFEMETEENGRINYLDVTVYRDEGVLKTIWYQKHISSGQFLNYHTNHPKTTIWHTAVQYVVTMMLNTHEDQFENILETAMDRLTRNSFPRNKAARIIASAKQKIVQKETGSQYTATQDKDTNIFYTQSIEYIPKLTAKIQRDIIDSHKKQGEDRNMQIPATPMYTMGKMVFNPHKNSNSEFVLEEHEGNARIDLTQPEAGTSHNT